MPRKNAKKVSFGSNVGEDTRLAIALTLRKFFHSDNAEYEFPSSYEADDRRYIHEIARSLGFKSKSRGKGMNRFLTIYKREKSAIIQSDAAFSLNQNARNAITSMMSAYPISNKERQDTMPLAERDRFCAHDGALRDMNRTNRLGNQKPQVPAKSVNLNLVQFRRSLPIWPQREEILEAINNSQVCIISGETGSGKTTQVPQYILEQAESTQHPVRIICSQPRRISAVSVYERVSLERNQEYPSAVGYQIRLECRTSAKTVLTYVTNGVLLQALMSGGDQAVSAMTHVIIDEVHERDKTADFLLIALRDLLAKHHTLRLILMSATMDIHLFTNYFSNAAVITVPGRQFPVQEYYLEDILKHTGYMSSEMGRLKAECEKKEKQKANLERWGKASTATAAAAAEPQVASSRNAEQLRLRTAILGQGKMVQHLPEKFDLEPWLVAEMDRCIADAWLTGSESAFAQLMHHFLTENVSVDYQHSETGMTTLMVAAARGQSGVCDQLLGLGANVNIRLSNDWMAIDYADKMEHTEIVELLQTYMNCYENATLQPPQSVSSPAEMSDENRQLLEMYNMSFNNENVDTRLIITILHSIHESLTPGAVLIFLPGYDEIVSMRDVITVNESSLLQWGKLHVMMLHSKMQTSEQKKVFHLPEPGTRKIILSTNIAETSITIEDIIFVIDSGKVKEKCFNALSGVSSLETSWISQATARQRSGRAGRTQPGVCYHLFSSAMYRTMQPHQTPEILRVPLQELCLQSKLLASPNTTIADYLARAIEPPSFAVTRNAVQLLKTMDAFDTWEDLTEMGRHLLELGVEPRYGKMLLAAVVLRCLDPVLTIVACLSYREPFVLPLQPWMKRAAAIEKKKYAANTFSDHMALLRAFQAWQGMGTEASKRQLCERGCISHATMELISGVRAQVLGHLRASGMVRNARGQGDIRELNTNSEIWPVVKAALAAGLYPNLARFDREHNILRTQKEFKVLLHPSSVLKGSQGGGVEGGGSLAALPTEWLLYEEMTRNGRLCHLRSCTAVTPTTVAIFAGPSRLPGDALSDTAVAGCLESDSEEEETASSQTALLRLDEWLAFRVDSDAAHLLYDLRTKWHALFVRRIRHPHKLWTQTDDAVLSALVTVLVAEEQALGLVQPGGIGMKPKMHGSEIFHTPTVRQLEEMTLRDEPIQNAFLATIENSGARFANLQRQWPANMCERSESGNKHSASLQAPTTSQGIIGTPQGNNFCGSGTRYFIIKTGAMRSLDASVVNRAWTFNVNTEKELRRAFRSRSAVLLVLGLGGLSNLQGCVRLLADRPDPLADVELAGGGPALPIEWVRRGSLPIRQTLSKTHQRLLQNSRDGQEIPTNLGEILLKLWDQASEQPVPSATQSTGHYQGRAIRGGAANSYQQQHGYQQRR